MPLYEYRCPSCRGIFAVQRPWAESGEPAPCPACEDVEARRLLMSPIVISKGREDDDAGSDRHGAAKAHMNGCPCCSFERPTPSTASRSH